ncbi:MAG: chorismate synthase [Pseudobutyrivibrio sp.]|nr:chorismate synthase [Pseudobutyrivibrio sp.]
MAGSTFGETFRISTWGESHGAALGVVIDGVPAGLTLDLAHIQQFMDRRKPGQSKFTTARNEADAIEILSGVFEGKTTGTPISMMVRNADQHSKDYSDIAEVFRPGHADYTFWEKYGIRDYRGGGRSSGRETIGRVAAGAIAVQILEALGITICAYTKSIGPVEIEQFDATEIHKNPLAMPDANAAKKAQEYLENCIHKQDSSGGVIECRVQGMPVGIGEPVFDKLDATLAKAMLSIGAVKGFEIGDGFLAATATGSTNNDAFVIQDEQVKKQTNHSGGVLGGMSDGDEIVFRVAVKPTPSISQAQQTVDLHGKERQIEIHGRHDPVIVPRAVVVVESMAAITLVDALFANMSARMDAIVDFYQKR